MTSQAGAVLRRPGGVVSTFLLGTASNVSAADGAWALRKLNGDYTGYCVNGRRSSDNTTQDIGFSGHDFDVVSALAFAGAGNLDVEIIYDQSGNGRDMLLPSYGSRYRLVTAGVMETKNSLPMLRALDQHTGMLTNPFTTAYTGTSVTAAGVAVLPNGSGDAAPRILSLLPSAAGLFDANAQGASMLSRNDTIGSLKTATLVDDFTVLTPLWTPTASGAVISGGQLVCTPTSTYNGFTSVAKYDLTSSQCTVKLVQRANQGGGTVETQFLVKTDASNAIGFIVSGTGLTMRERAAGTNSDTFITFNATNHKYLRIRESAGVLYWDTSPDGTTWTQQRSRTRTGTNPTAAQVVLQAGYYGTETTPGTAIFDDVNIPVQNVAGSSWSLARAGVNLATSAATSNTLQQVTSQINGAQSLLRVDGTSVTASTTSTAFSFNRYGLGHTGLIPQTATGLFIAEVIVWNKALTATEQSTVQLNQSAYWGTAAQTGGTSPYTLIAEDTFDDNVFRSSNFVVYNNGVMTSNAGAWMSSEVSVSNQRLRTAVRKTSTPVTIGGTNYYRRGGAWYWEGPDDGSLGAAFKKGGYWECRIRMDACGGFGFAVLLWPREGSSFGGNASWPINGEIDGLEIYSGNTNKFGGESNWHLDTVANSGRHLKCPTSSTHSPSPLVSAGNYQVDWTTFHKLGCLWIPGQRVETFVDDVSVGYTTDPTYVPSGTHNGFDVPFRLTVQSEAYGTADSAADLNTHYIEVDYLRYYALS